MARWYRPSASELARLVEGRLLLAEAGSNWSHSLVLDILDKIQKACRAILGNLPPHRGLSSVNGRDASGVDDQLQVLSGLEVSGAACSPSLVSAVQRPGTEVSVSVSAYHMASVSSGVCSPHIGEV